MLELMYSTGVRISELINIKIHDLNINMNSILSRPLKTLMGKYKFYIECSFKDNGYILLNDLLRKLSVNFKVDLIGIYKGC